MVPAELQLEVDQLYMDGQEEFLKDFVDFQRHPADDVELFLRGEADGQNMGFVDHGVPQLVALIAELQHGAFHRRPLRQAEPLGEAASRLVADDDFQRDDLDLFDERLPVAELPDKVRGDSVFLQQPEQVVGHLVVDDALAGDGALFQAVERRGVVLIVHDAEIRIVRCKDLFGLAFVKLFLFFHCFAS